MAKVTESTLVLYITNSDGREMNINVTKEEAKELYEALGKTLGCINGNLNYPAGTR